MDVKRWKYILFTLDHFLFVRVYMAAAQKRQEFEKVFTNFIQYICILFYRIGVQKSKKRSRSWSFRTKTPKDLIRMLNLHYHNHRKHSAARYYKCRHLYAPPTVQKKSYILHSLLLNHQHLKHMLPPRLLKKQTNLRKYYPTSQCSFIVSGSINQYKSRKLEELSEEVLKLKKMYYEKMMSVCEEKMSLKKKRKSSRTYCRAFKNINKHYKKT